MKKYGTAREMNTPVRRDTTAGADCSTCECVTTTSTAATSLAASKPKKLRFFIPAVMFISFVSLIILEDSHCPIHATDQRVSSHHIES